MLDYPSVCPCGGAAERREDGVEFGQTMTIQWNVFRERTLRIKDTKEEDTVCCPNHT